MHGKSLYMTREETLIGGKIALMCPQCYNITQIESHGCISVRMDKHLEHDLDLIARPKYSLTCPICHNRIEGIILDYEIANVISRLNKIGLTTEICCAGHEYEGVINHGFIRFVNPLPDEYIKLLPESWCIPDDKNKTFLQRIDNHENTKALDITALNYWIYAVKNIKNTKNIKYISIKKGDKNND